MVISVKDHASPDEGSDSGSWVEGRDELESPGAEWAAETRWLPVPFSETRNGSGGEA